MKRALFYEHFFYNEDYKIYSDGEFFMYTICSKNVPYKHLDLTISIYDFTGISSNPKYKNLHQEERFKSINKFFPLFIEDYKVLSKWKLMLKVNKMYRAFLYYFKNFKINN